MNKVIFTKTHYPDSIYTDYYAKYGEFEFIITLEELKDNKTNVKVIAYLGDCQDQIYQNETQWEGNLKLNDELVIGLAKRLIEDTYEKVILMSESIRKVPKIEIK